MMRGGIWKSGDPFLWLAAGALGTALLMTGGLLWLIVTRALGVFWPATLVLLELHDGERLLGHVRASEQLPGEPAGSAAGRFLIQVANRDLTAADFVWVDASKIKSQSFPKDAVVVERTEWGNFFGWIVEVREGATVVAEGGEQAWRALQEALPGTLDLVRRIRRLERGELGDINYEIEAARLEERRHELQGGDPQSLLTVRERLSSLQSAYERLQAELQQLSELSLSKVAVFQTADGRTKEIPLAQMVRVYRPNEMSVQAKVRFYLAKLWEFVSGEPRESNTEGGVFPAIFGTVLMVLIMSAAVVPFGVLAALYLREYARQGPLVRVVRISINNLAGVPSIVFGVFGLGFFIYSVGGTIDSWFFAERLPSPTFGTGGILWASLTLALLTVPVVIVATEEALAAVPREHREGSYALGATKYETIRNVVLPSALPGVFTGLILAMARGAGEVAPLMITGVVKLAPSLPLDHHWPYLHLERKFMHLGFHIYDVGFQSPNIEAAKPMVYATTLLLVGIVVFLNLTAIFLRARIRRRLYGGAF
jgi:phosphate transport system permease protein